MFAKFHTTKSNTATLRQSAREHRPRLARGLAAVEFAIILPLMVVLLAFPLFFGRLFMHYSVAQKAAHDAVMFVTRATELEVSGENTLVGATELARQIALVELRELYPGRGSAIYVGVTCDGYPCGPSKPEFIRVTIQMRMRDDMFNFFTYRFVGDKGFLITADVSMPYLGK